MTAPPSPPSIPCNSGGSEEQQRVRELAALFAVSAAINQSINETDALRAALRQVLQVLCLDGGRIYLLDEAGGEYALAAAEGDPVLLEPSETDMIPGQCRCGFVGYTVDGEGQELITLNGILDPDHIEVGDVLDIPPPTTSSTTTTSTTTTTLPPTTTTEG